LKRNGKLGEIAMKIFSRKKDNKGFTTTEIILVVAILIIAMAIAVPGIVRLSRNLKIAKLDDIAREIYTAAQSRAVSLSVSGQLIQVEGVEARIYVSPAEPAEGDPAAGDEESSTPFKCVYKSGTVGSSDDKDLDMLLPLGGIDEGVRQNYFIIEYNPVTAMINGVYYWEKDTSKFYEDSTAGYGEINPKDRSARMKYAGGMVGYYDGSDVEGRLVYTGPVQAKLINEEELYLEITQGREDVTAVPLNGTITVTLTDLDTKKSMKIASFKNESGFVISPGVDPDLIIESGSNFYGSNLRYVNDHTGTYDAPYYKLTLDSLNAELRFSKIIDRFKNHNTGLTTDSFHPGCNLRVTVSFKEDGGEKVQEESFLTNSLFASVKDKKDAAGSEYRTALIAYGRHLENLGLPWVYPDKAKADKIDMDDTLNGVKYAEQTKDIDWSESLKALVPANAADPSITPQVSFKPIINKNLKGFDGGGNIIRHMDIFEDANGLLAEEYERFENIGIGLFSRFEGEKLENVNLVDCTVKGLTKNDLHVGLLAGMIDDTSAACEVSNCHAYAKVDSGNPAAPDKCSIEAANAESVGGLIGYVNNVKPTTIKQSSASLTQIVGTDANVGGLTGRINCGGKVEVSSCYADTGICNPGGTWQSGMSGSNVGGLLGNIDGSGSFTMENSYAVGSVSGSNTYGLVGSGSGTRTISNCYAALMKGNDFVSGLVPTGITGTNNCFSYNGIYSGFDSLINNSVYVRASAKTTNPYGLYAPDETSKENTSVYPFPRLKDMPHYGDWPQEGPGVVMAYYEVYKYKDTNKYSIGFYNDTLFKAGTEYALKDDEDYTVVMDGYAVMLPVESGKYGTFDVGSDLLKNGVQGENLIVKYNNDDFSKNTEVHANNLRLRDASKKFVWDISNIENNQIKIEDKSYYPLFLSSTMMVHDKWADDSYYQKLEVQIRSKADAGSTEANADPNAAPTDNVIAVYFNPYVAKSEFLKVEEGENAPAAPPVSIMRTSRQITAYSYQAMQSNAIGASSSKGHTLRLERDITLTSKSNINTDATINGGIKCVDLSIPNNQNAYVILELNGKTLTGTNDKRAVTCKGGKLEVYGTEKNPTETEETDSTDKGTIEGCGISMETGVTGLLKDVKIVYIKKPADNESSVSVNVSQGVTLEGCTITEESQ